MMWRSCRYHKDGYECSSKGDKRFSAFYAILPDGKSIEHHYQVTVKGYSSIKEGKGKPAKNGLDRFELWDMYLLLWQMWAEDNPAMIEELYQKTKEHRILTDMFATSDINQARALCYIMNERYSNE